MKLKNYLTRVYDGKVVVLKLDQNLDENISLKQFLEYIRELKKHNIKIIILDKDGDELFNIFGTNPTANQIANLLILDNDYKILNKKGKQVEFLSYNRLLEILEGRNKFISIDKNSPLYKKLEEIKKMLENGYSKITLTNVGGIKKELEGFEGNGTMFVNLDKAKFKKLNNWDIFQEIYKQQLEKGNWKERDEKELKEISDNYTVLDLDGTILGGYSLRDFKINVDGKEKQGKILENLFSFVEGGGIGPKLMEEVKKNSTVFAYSKKDDFFSCQGFEKKENYKSETGASFRIFEDI